MQPIAERKIKVDFSPDGRRYSGEFPTVPRERFRVLINCFSSAPKAIAFLLIPYAGQIRERDLVGQFSELASGNSMENIDHSTLRSYVDKGLLPNGLVSKTTLGDENRVNLRRVYYSRTDRGKMYGIPAAVLALDFEMRNKISLRRIFGTSNSKTDSQAPFVRAAILLSVFGDHGTSRRKELYKELGFAEETVRQALRLLSSNHLIETNPLPRNVAFELTENLPSVESRKGPLTTTVISICQYLSLHEIPITTTSVAGVLRARGLDRYSSEHSRQVHISEMLNALTRKGYLKKTGFMSEKSEVRITKKGKTLIKEFLLPLLRIASSSDPTPTVSYDLITEVITNLARYAGNSIELYSPYSGGKIEERAENFAKVLSMVQKTSSGVSISEISKRLGLNIVTIANYLRTMGAIYSLKIEKRGTTKYYSVEHVKQPFPEKHPSFIERITEALNNEQEISSEDRVILLTYGTWVLHGSIGKTARILGVEESRVKQCVDVVLQSDELTEVFERISPQEEDDEEG